jgi:hypothetical protein
MIYYNEINKGNDELPRFNLATILSRDLRNAWTYCRILENKFKGTERQNMFNSLAEMLSHTVYFNIQENL